MVSGHLGTPTVDDLVVTEEKDGSVTSLEARVGPLLNSYVLSATQHMKGTRYMGE